jgi:hypothetical protein
MANMAGKVPPPESLGETELASLGKPGKTGQPSPVRPPAEGKEQNLQATPVEQSQGL